MWPEVQLFAGPSARGLPAATLSQVNVRPPAQRGDIDALRSASDSPATGVIVLCDGVFGSDAAVSHAELCRAIDAGWVVWGTSSMGAIRAHELRREGMHGWGWVYAQFARRCDFRDDEMALVHLPCPPYTPLTEALVNLRWALHKQGAALGIPASVARRLLAWLQSLCFTERSPELIHDLLVGPANLSGGVACALMDWTARYPVKNLDLLTLLRARPWRDGIHLGRPP